MTDKNTITITDKSGTISAMSYVPGSIVVSKGKSHDDHLDISKKDDTWTIELKADRHGTSDVATTFNDATGAAQNRYAPDGGSGSGPNKLNFCFAVAVEFAHGGATTTATLHLAQGHYLTVNNWWMGGADVFRTSKHASLQVPIGDSGIQMGLSGSHDSFTVGDASTYHPSPIKYVFVLMLENHSFDNVLGMSGLPGITAPTGKTNTHDGTTYTTSSPAPDSMPKDPHHDFTEVVRELCGHDATYTAHQPYPKVDNSGFASEYAKCVSGTDHPVGDIMKCFDTATQVPATYDLAKNFTVCDSWFSSLPGPTWPNRYFVHGASSSGLDDSPSSGDVKKWVIESSFRYPNGSIFDALNDADVPWRTYIDYKGSEEFHGGNFAQVASIHNVGLLRIHHLSGMSGALSKQYPYQYTFIEPNYGHVANTYEDGSSQHPVDGMGDGDALVKSVYETIRNSPIWESSMLVVTYDEHGGFYDSVAPGAAPQPGDGDPYHHSTHDFLFDQYGVRVPAIIASPWVAATVDSTLYDHASVPATLESLFDMDPLTNRDRGANDLLGHLLDQPRTDCPKHLSDPAAPVDTPARTDAEQAALAATPLPDRGNIHGFLHVALKADLDLASTEEERAAILARFERIETRGHAGDYFAEVDAKVEAARAAAAEQRTDEAPEDPEHATDQPADRAAVSTTAT